MVEVDVYLRISESVTLMNCKTVILCYFTNNPNSKGTTFLYSLHHFLYQLMLDKCGAGVSH
jgi:hypothetical protein